MTARRVFTTLLCFIALASFVFIMGCAGSNNEVSGPTTATEEASDNASEALEEYVHTSELAGFSASFTAKPDEQEHQEGDKHFVEVIDEGGYSGFTYVTVIFEDSMGHIRDSMNADTSNPDFDEWLSEMVSSSMQAEASSLEPLDSNISPVVSTIDGYPCAYCLVPCVFHSEGDMDGANVYHYYMMVATDDKLFSIDGTRITEEAARKALDSFSLL